jgi:hypothetical protein
VTKMELMAGITEECFTDFIERFPTLAIRQLVAEFTHVQESTVDSWINRQNWPKGESLLRLRCLLNQVGYQVEEFERLPEDNQKLARTVAFGGINVEETRTALGYEHGKGVFDVVLRGTLVMPARAITLEKLLNANQASTQEGISRFEQRWQQALDGTGSNAIGLSQDLPSTQAERIVEALVMNLAAASELCRVILGDDELKHLLFQRVTKDNLDGICLNLASLSSQITAEIS